MSRSNSMGSDGSSNITTSDEVRRSACVERYLHREFTRFDVAA